MTDIVIPCPTPELWADEHTIEAAERDPAADALEREELEHSISHLTTEQARQLGYLKD